MTIVFSFRSSSKKVYARHIKYEKVLNIRKGKEERKEDTNQTIIQRSRQPHKVQPDIKRARRRNINFKSHMLQTRQNMVTLDLEMFL